jgi:hypothetical protein
MNPRADLHSMVKRNSPVSLLSRRIETKFSGRPSRTLVTALTQLTGSHAKHTILFNSFEGPGSLRDRTLFFGRLAYTSVNILLRTRYCVLTNMNGMCCSKMHCCSVCSVCIKSVSKIAQHGLIIGNAKDTSVLRIVDTARGPI